MQRSQLLRFTPFAYNPASSRPATGRPSGAVNRMLSIGLPPWAAWCTKLNRHAYYRLSGVAERSFIPTPAHKTDIIWMNERVRERVRTSRLFRHVYKQNQYPHVRTGLHHSDALDHWVQLPMVQSAMYAVEQDGGIDNFITKRSGIELKSRYGERLRRHIIVRQKEIQKNHVLASHSSALTRVILGEIKAAKTKEEAMVVFNKYGIDKDDFMRRLASSLQRKRKTRAATSSE